MSTVEDSPSLVLDQVVWTERRYVEALNAVLATPGGEDGSDVDRWRGHAEAYRAVSEDLRRRFGLPAANLCSREWRDAHGVYSKKQVAAFRRAEGEVADYLAECAENGEAPEHDGDLS